MSDVGVTLVTGLALGVTYGLLGAAVSLVWTVTRSLHLAVGPVLVAGVLVRLFLGIEVLVDLPAIVPLLAGITVAAVVSVLLEPLVLRPLRDGLERLIGLAVAGVVIEVAILRVLGARTFRPQPVLSGVGDLGVGGTTVPGPVLTAIALGLPLVALLIVLTRRTRFGRALRLVGGSPEAAELLGVPAAGTRRLVLAVSGAAVAVAGLLVAPVASLGVTQGAAFTLRAVAAAALCGVAGPRGALVGGVVLGLAEALSQQLAPSVPGDVAIGVVVVGVMLAAGDPTQRRWGRAW